MGNTIMMTKGKALLGALAVLLAAILLSGCSGSLSSTRYTVKSYSGGKAVANFEATEYTSGDSRIYATLTNGRKVVVGGTFSVVRTDAGAANTTARPTKYTAQLFSGGTVVEQYDAYDYSTGDGKIYLHLSRTERVVVGGTFVLTRLGTQTDGIADSARYKVSVYSDGILIKTWHADSYTAGDGRIYLTINGITEAVAIGGQYVVEQFR